MVSDPPPQSTALFTVFKALAFTLIAVNVIWHGTVAMFIGGPFGLVVFLGGVAAVWGGAWYMVRRSRESERAAAIQAAEADRREPDAVGTRAE